MTTLNARTGCRSLINAWSPDGSILHAYPPPPPFSNHSRAPVPSSSSLHFVHFHLPSTFFRSPHGLRVPPDGQLPPLAPLVAVQPLLLRRHPAVPPRGGEADREAGHQNMRQVRCRLGHGHSLIPSFSHASLTVDWLPWVSPCYSPPSTTCFPFPEGHCYAVYTVTQTLQVFLSFCS